MINELEGKFTKLSGLMRKFKYSSDDNDNDEKKDDANFEDLGETSLNNLILIISLKVLNCKII